MMVTVGVFLTSQKNHALFLKSCRQLLFLPTVLLRFRHHYQQRSLQIKLVREQRLKNLPIHHFPLQPFAPLKIQPQDQRSFQHKHRRRNLLETEQKYRRIYRRGNKFKNQHKGRRRSLLKTQHKHRRSNQLRTQQRLLLKCKQPNLLETRQRRPQLHLH